MLNLLMLFSLTFLVVTAAIAGTATGKVESIHAADRSPIVLFTLSGPIEDSPRCNDSGRFAFDGSQPGGSGMLDVLLMAKQKDYTVTVVGLNGCGYNWKSEDVKNIRVH